MRQPTYSTGMINVTIRLPDFVFMDARKKAKEKGLMPTTLLRAIIMEKFCKQSKEQQKEIRRNEKADKARAVSELPKEAG